LADPAGAHADLLVRLAASKPPRIALRPKPEDFADCARHVEDVIEACKAYLIGLIGYADENEQGSSIAKADVIGSIEAHLSDLAGEMSGTLDRLANRMIDEASGGNARRHHQY
jgi:hypothetical protein